MNTRLDDIELNLTAVGSLKIEQNKLCIKLNTFEDHFLNLEKDLNQLNRLMSDLLRKMRLLEVEYIHRSQQQNHFLNVEIVSEKSGEHLVQVLIPLANFVNANIISNDIEFIMRVQPHRVNPSRPFNILITTAVG